MAKIKMNPIAELDGDEMTRVLWQLIKDELICPYVDLQTEYYDLGLPKRDETADKITVESAEAIKRLKVGVKCATITPDAKRMTEYNLKEMWKSPNATIRAALDGTVFRAPILTSRIKPYVQSWKKPITLARHAYGDIYKASEYRVPSAGKAELVFTSDSGEVTRQEIFNFKGPGIIQGIHNIDASIEAFAVTCFEYALSVGQDLWFGAKDTISKTYDGHFRDVFERIYNEKYASRFKEKGISYFYTLIDDAVARVIRSEGGMIWACKNYDGDVMSDMVSTAFGSLGMMTSVLVSPDGCYEYEAAHGTVTQHYYRWRRGETTSTNPVATAFAWTGALRKRGELDGNAELVNFAGRLEAACLDTIEAGIMTGDLARLCKDSDVKSVDTITYIKEVASRL
jgi:isocitrate dehydrogenase